MILKADDFLNQRYRILRLLSDKGGMGLVYLATDLNLGDTVVVKQSLVSSAASLRHNKNYHGLTEAELHSEAESLQQAFEREAKLLRRLRHDALPRVLDYFKTADGDQFLVMEFIPGKDFGDLLDERQQQQQGPFPLKQVLGWTDQLLDVLHYLHTRFERPIIHRDIKPRNLKLMPDGQIVLLDFGLAKGAPSGSIPYISVPGGSPFYSPLEQIEDHSTDVRSDFYALSVTMHHLLTGQKPSGAATRARAMLGNPSHDPLRPLCELNPQIPPAISEVFQRAAALHQDDRYSSAAAMREALRQAVAPAPSAVAAQPEPELPTSVRPKSVASELKRRIEIAINPGKEELKPKLVEHKPTLPPIFIEDLGNDVKLEMVYIPGGSFLMGSPDGVGYDKERPQHRVTLSSFYIGKYTITRAQWKAVMNWSLRFSEGDDLPVVLERWEHAESFCEGLSNLVGKTYRLPTEAEWEYACRAGSIGKYCFGDDETLLGLYAWYEDNSEGEIHRVGQKKPNAWGLHDMHGNVREWCQDAWHDNYNGAPCDGSAWLDDGDLERRILRGASYMSLSAGCRAADRGYSNPRIGATCQGSRHRRLKRLTTSWTP